MESIWNKFSYDRAAVIEEAFSIATNRGQQEWSNADRYVMSQAANDIVRSLGGDSGLTFVEFEVLVAYAARSDPEIQLRFLTNLVDVIRESRGIGSLSYYDEQFIDFVMGIHNELIAVARRNAGLDVSPGPNVDIAQRILDERQAPVDSMQLPSGETTCTWKSEYEEISGEGKYTSSVVRTVTGDAFMSGGAYNTTSTTSSSFTPSSIPMLGIHEASVDIQQSVEDFALTPERRF
ncbi:hypothetical protein H9Q69_010204 [Fusarium xylarioides]|uniref:Uncharacterized protein n=1 Tax=Fusarium xylarioides TaxID=221167 RepID=A0A9P7KXA6_9HYPO|nr:hypothetical protein H9Q70_010456 [Fusarium xylarioides]KAG5760740.1 hypothetical protein H9Q72_011140 [Fusarium xylarioides]KAG5776011.1 hypothetical protein H9Q73_010327 [Fusarium xylarioides]KAG5790739.1 hypothetical protein H9Q69_010204 [Fusarium xylarioides]